MRATGPLSSGQAERHARSPCRGHELRALPRCDCGAERDERQILAHRCPNTVLDRRRARAHAPQRTLGERATQCAARALLLYQRRFTAPLAVQFLCEFRNLQQPHTAQAFSQRTCERARGTHTERAHSGSLWLSVVRCAAAAVPPPLPVRAAAAAAAAAGRGKGKRRQHEEDAADCDYGYERQRANATTLRTGKRTGK